MSHFESERRLFFDPSRLDRSTEELAWQLVRHLKPSCGLLAGSDLGASHPFDLVIECEGPAGGRRKVALWLVDGARPPALTDEEKASVLQQVDVCYRTVSPKTNQQLTDLVFLLSRWEPALFAPADREALRQKASRGARCEVVHGAIDEAQVFYPEPRVEVTAGGIPECPKTPVPLVVSRLKQPLEPAEAVPGDIHLQNATLTLPVWEMDPQPGRQPAYS